VEVEAADRQPHDVGLEGDLAAQKGVAARVVGRPHPETPEDRERRQRRRKLGGVGVGGDEYHERREERDREEGFDYHTNHPPMSPNARINPVNPSVRSTA